MASLLFNPSNYDPTYLDEESRKQMQALVKFFENKGKAKLRIGEDAPQRAHDRAVGHREHDVVDSDAVMGLGRLDVGEREAHRLEAAVPADLARAILLTVNGVAGARKLGGSLQIFTRLTEIMR